MAETSTSLTVKCPNCQKPVLWDSGNPFRPFCCERCKLIDLGEWANEEKAIPGQPLNSEIDPDDDSFFQ